MFKYIRNFLIHPILDRMDRTYASTMRELYDRLLSDNKLLEAALRSQTALMQEVAGKRFRLLMERVDRIEKKIGYQGPREEL